jgi:hypothetical protein
VYKKLANLQWQTSVHMEEIDDEGAYLHNVAPLNPSCLLKLK